MTMTRDYAIKEGFISPIQDNIEQEREHDYVRITHWYGPDEDWMAENAFRTLRGTDSILVVNRDQQAVYRHKSQIKLYEAE